MALVDALGLTPRDKPRARLIRAAVASRAGSWVSRRTLHHVDRWVFRLTGQRTTAVALISGLPVLMVTTTGARTGKERTVPILGVPFRGAMALIGSNFGQAPTPGWVHNLRANPKTSIVFRGRKVTTVARRAGPKEEEDIFAEASRWYVGFAKYRARVIDREIVVFVLEPA